MEKAGLLNGYPGLKIAWLRKELKEISILLDSVASLEESFCSVEKIRRWHEREGDPTAAGFWRKRNIRARRSFFDFEDG
jgi:hypothetical protein